MRTEKVWKRDGRAMLSIPRASSAKREGGCYLWTEGHFPTVTLYAGLYHKDFTYKSQEGLLLLSVDFRAGFGRSAGARCCIVGCLDLVGSLL